MPDGPNYEDLGINLRTMVQQIYQNLLPELEPIKHAYNTSIDLAGENIQQLLTQDIFFTHNFNESKIKQVQAELSEKPNLIHRIFGRKRNIQTKYTIEKDEPPEFKALKKWKASLEIENDPSGRHCL